MDKIIWDTIIWVRGDSISAWIWDPEKWGRVVRLHTYLCNVFLGNDDYYWVAYNLGIDGDTSEWVLKRFDVECEARQPNSIMFAIGSNDCTVIDNKETTISLDTFKKNIALLTEKAKKFTDKIVFVWPIICDETKTNPIPRVPNMSQDMKTTSMYNDAIKSFCSQNNILFIDMIDVLDKQDLEDGMHPTAQGHEKMYIRIREFLLDKKMI